MPDIIIPFNACGHTITWPLAQGVVDKARSEGYPKSALRWRCGVAQMRSIQIYLSMLSKKEDVQRFEAEYGNAETIMFCGVPAYIDTTVAADEIFLEAVKSIETIGRIGALAIPVAYWEDKQG